MFYLMIRYISSNLVEYFSHLSLSPKCLLCFIVDHAFWAQAVIYRSLLRVLIYSIVAFQLFLSTLAFLLLLWNKWCNLRLSTGSPTCYTISSKPCTSSVSVFVASVPFHSCERITFVCWCAYVCARLCLCGRTKAWLRILPPGS